MYAVDEIMRSHLLSLHQIRAEVAKVVVEYLQKIQEDGLTKESLTSLIDSLLQLTNQIGDNQNLPSDYDEDYMQELVSYLLDAQEFIRQAPQY